MKYEFPKLRHLNDFLPAIKDRDDFIHADRGWFSYINYAYSTPLTFLSPNEEGISAEERHKRIVLTECRGVVFDVDGNMISRPVHKFFNLNEKPDTLMENIDWDQGHTFLDKLDGSMIRPIYNAEHDNFRFGTKAGLSDVALNAEVFVAQNPKYFKFARDLHEEGLHPGFEWLSKINQIVVSYNQEDLVLTTVRNLYTGQYLSYEKMESLAKKYEIPLVKFLYSSGKVDSFIQDIYNRTDDIEGYVVRFDDGHMLKIKTLQYCQMHSSKERAESMRTIFKHVSEGTIDDIKPFLLGEDLVKVGKWEIEYFKLIEEETKRYQNVYDTLFKNMDAREFAVNHKKDLDPLTASMIFTCINGKNLRDAVAHYIDKFLGKDKDFEELRRQLNF